jgi:hypothetical protein
MRNMRREKAAGDTIRLLFSGVLPQKSFTSS